MLGLGVERVLDRMMVAEISEVVVLMTDCEVDIMAILPLVEIMLVEDVLAVDDLLVVDVLDEKVVGADIGLNDRVALEFEAVIV